MPKPDFRGARGSNAGDDFHELWSLSQALTLLDRETTLTGITVEGLRPGDEEGVPAETFDGVDCAMFHNGESVATAERIEIVQFKYSASDRESPWTAARLTSSSAKTRDNSVIHRLADLFGHFRQVRGGSNDGIRLQLISNQPVSPSVVKLVDDIKSGRALSDDARSDKDRLQKSSGLQAEVFLEFIAALDFSQTGSRFLIKERLLTTVSAWTEGDSRALTDSLLRFMREKMMPEARGEWIRRESILAELGFSDPRAIFPCPPELAPIRHIVARETSSEFAAELVSGEKHVCIHGQAGCGKTTALREIERQLPAGSVMIIFDCYGAGRYLDSDAFRHRPKDAFLQLSNELASRLHVPLLLTTSDAVDYPRAFQHRVERAAQGVSGLGHGALLVIAVDAADNAVTAAQELVPQERSFVSDFVSLGDVPDNVRLLVTARTGRLDQLGLPSRFKRCEISGFTRDETAEHVRSTWKDAPDSWIDELHELSGHNPRVQQYALSWAGDQPQLALEYLLPSGKGLFDVFRHQLEEAQKKAGSSEPFHRLSAALSALPHPVPFPDLSAISGLSEPELTDICTDLAPGIRTKDGTVGFSDEDFETFVRSEGDKRLGEVVPHIADRFMLNRQTDPYAATHLVAALYAAGRGHDVLQIVETEPEPIAIHDPILRRETRFHRLRVAMQVCTEAGDQSLMLRVLLIGAEAMHGNEAILNLVLKFPDLAAAFMQEGGAGTVLRNSNLIRYHGPLLFHLFREKALAQNRIAARGEHRQLTAWLEKRRRELDSLERHRQSHWKITALDVAAEIEAILALDGPEAGVKALRRWKPRRLHLEVARIVTQRLIVSGNVDILKGCLADGLVKQPWNLLLLVPLALAGQNVDLYALQKAANQLMRRGFIRLKELAGPNQNSVSAFLLDTVLTGCEIFIAKGGTYNDIAPLLHTFADESLRHIEHFRPFQSSVIDLQLRAQALLVRCEGRQLTIDRFLMEPSNPATRGGSSARDREEAGRFLRPLLPLYDARARLLLNDDEVSDAAKVLDSAIESLAHDDYSFSRIHGESQIRERAAVGLASLRFLFPAVPAMLIEQCLKVFGRSLDPFGSSELAVLSTFALNPESHSDVVKILVSRATEITAQRTVASEKVEALLNISRFVAQISRDEASAMLGLAHAATEEMDVEGRHQLRAVAALAARGSSALDSVGRRDAAQGLYSIATDSAVRLADEEGYPWDEIIEALVSLDVPVAFASIARWQDAGRLDLNLSISELIRRAVSQNAISVVVGTSLLPLIERRRTSLVELLCRGLNALPVAQQQTLIEELAKDAVLAAGAGDDPSEAYTLKQPLASDSPAGPWLRRRDKLLDFLTSASRTSSKRQDPEAQPGDNAVSSTAGLGNYLEAFKSAEQIVRTIEAEIKAARLEWEEAATVHARRFVSAEDILEEIRKAVPVAGRLTYLASLSAAHSERISDSTVAHSIYRAVEAWKSSLSVRTWCRDHLPIVISERLPGFCVNLSYEGRSPLLPLLDILAAEQVDVTKVLASGIGKHVEEMSATVVYELGRLITEKLAPTDAASALVAYLDRLTKRIPNHYMDRMETSDIPTEVDSAVARLLFALMSDCDVRIRWRAAHSVRRLARVGCTNVLAALLTVYERKTEDAFRASGEPFYWMAARLWWNIAIQRIAHEIPSAVAGYGPKLLEIATDETFPHVLIRSFAKDTALTLRARGQLKLSAARLKALSNANNGQLPRKKGGRTYGRASAQRNRDVRERAFHFDPVDTIPYWYEPALGIFADVTQDEFLDAAENWIVRKWEITTRGSRWDLESRKYRFSMQHWTASTNGHGSDPTLEPFPIYLERHAMFCAIGDLIQSSALTQSDDGYDSMEGWLTSRGLEFPPLWLADFRGPVPLESRFWREPASDITTWVGDVSAEDFSSELGARTDMIIINGWHNTSSSGFSSEVYVSSALVESGTATALVRALQSAKDTSDYRLPDEGEEQFEIESPPYRLLGWLRDANQSYSGIDQKDPFRKSVRGLGAVPGKLASNNLVETTSPEGWPVWSGRDGSTRYEHEAWSTKPDHEYSERPLRTFGSEGRRLWVSVVELQDVLAAAKMDLIVSIKVMRQEGDDGYSEDDKEQKRSWKAKILLLRANGDIEDAEGRIGAWKAHRNRTPT